VVAQTAVAAAGWTLGGSILTFAFPMILFVIAAAALWVLYTTPHAAARGSANASGRSVAATTAPAGSGPQPPDLPGEDGTRTAAGSAEGGQ